MAEKNEKDVNTKEECESKNEVQGSSGDGASSSNLQPDSLDDLLSTLKNQISNSDWLKTNTAEKWKQDNPELAKEYMELAKKS